MRYSITAVYSNGTIRTATIRTASEKFAFLRYITAECNRLGITATEVIIEEAD